MGGPVAYAEHAGHEAFGGYPGDFLWGCNFAPVVGWCWHSEMYSRKCVANERGKSGLEKELIWMSVLIDVEFEAINTVNTAKGRRPFQIPITISRTNKNVENKSLVQPVS